MVIKEIIKQTEGRRLELKEALPENADLANTIIVFANDAGFFICIGNNKAPIIIDYYPFLSYTTDPYLLTGENEK